MLPCLNAEIFLGIGRAGIICVLQIAASLSLFIFCFGF
jgi:hypothetical protein